MLEVGTKVVVEVDAIAGIINQVVVLVLALAADVTGSCGARTRAWC
jgi:hypothetical protein